MLKLEGRAVSVASVVRCVVVDVSIVTRTRDGSNAACALNDEISESGMQSNGG